MKPTALHIIYSCLLMVFMTSTAQARQSAGLPPLIEIRNLKDSLPVEANSFAFNNVSIFNKTQSLLHAQVSFSAPGFVDMLSATVQNIELKPGNNEVIPLRFTINSSQVPSEWYAVVAEIRFKELNQVTRTAFFIKPVETVQYKAVLQQPTISLLETDNEIPINLYIANTGNSADSYLITLQPGQQIHFDPMSYALDLVPGESRVVTPRIRLSPQDLQLLKKDELTIFIKSRSGEQKMLLQYVNRVGNAYMGTAGQWTKMPLTVELNLQNLLGNRPFGSVNVQGYLKLKDNAQLNVLLQSDNYFNGYTANTHLYTLQYAKGPWRITAGSILDYNNFLVDGMGARVQYSDDRNRQYDVMAVKSRLGDTRQFNFKTSQPINRQLTFSSNVFVNNDVKAGQTGSLAINKVDWTISSRTRLTIEAGGGMEKLSHDKLDTTLYGAEAGYRFETKGQHYMLNSAVSYYNKNFPGINKGFLYQLHEARYLWNTVFAGPFYEVNKRGYNNVNDSLLNYLFNVNNREYGVRTGWYRPDFSLVVSGGLFTQLQDSANAPEARMKKLSLNMNWQINDNWHFSLLSTAGRTSVEGLAAPIRPFNSFTNFMVLQSGRYGMQLRYDHGPYYYYEIRQYISNPSSWQRIQVSPFVELPWQKKNLYFRVQANYLHESQNNTNYLLVYNNVQYSMPKAGLDMSLTMQTNVTGKENPLVSFTIRKKLQMPVIKNRQVKNFKVLLFLDENRNGLPDAGETTLANARVMINNAMTITNDKGEIAVSNTNEERFAIDCSNAVTPQGWIPQMGYRQQITPASNQKLVLVPYVRSKTLSGKLLVVKDPNSSKNLLLNGIRVTALSSKGESFYTLTDEEGGFFFNLPAGQYTITINQAAFDEAFRVVEASKAADLEHNETLNLPFEIRQSKRVINIRRDTTN